MGCGTGGGGVGAYGGVVSVMARELARERGEGNYLVDAAEGIRAEVRERGLTPAGPPPTGPRTADRSNFVTILIPVLFLLAMGAVVIAHVTGYDPVLAGAPSDDYDD